MNKLSKLTALLLAIMLALGVPMQVMAESAETVDTWTEYMDIAQAALKTKIMAYQTYGEYWDMAKLIDESEFEDFFYTLPLEDQNAIAKYVNGMFWDSLVGFTNVAPLPELEVTQPASTFSVMTRDGTTDTVAEVDNGLYTNKQVTGPDDNGYYTITLENYATGTVTTNTTTEIKPVDIVLVLDDSGSMTQSFDANSSSDYVYTEVAYDSLDQTKEYYVPNSDDYRRVTWCSECSAWTRANRDHPNHTKYYSDTKFYERTEAQTKGEALVDAVNNFVDSVNANSPTEGTHQMSIVKFSGDSKNDTDAATVINTWTPVNDNTVTDLKLTGNDMVFDGGTWIEKGLTQAKSQLDSLTTTGRQRVVIVFTDGKPGGGNWYNEGGQYNDAESVGASAINIANSIKDMENTTIYTIAVLYGANPSAAVVSPATGIDTEGNANKINAILHGISSNYPDATAQSSGDTLTTTFNTINPLVDTNKNGKFDDGEPGYYLSASSASELSNIFQKISSSIQAGASSVTLDKTTIVRDEVTPYFEIPYVLNEDGTKDYTAAEITIYEAAYTSGTDDAPVFGTPTKVNYTYTINGNQLDVTGFDFSENAVMTVNGTRQGKKLIITFKIKAVDGFIGGNDVVTNTGNSGIIEVKKDETTGETKEEMFEAYPIPKVDVEMWEIKVIGADQHIYLSNEADLNVLLQSFSLEYTKAGSDKSYTVNGIRNGYATLQFTLTAESGEKRVYTIAPGAQAGTWKYLTASGDPMDNFDVTPFLTDHKVYTIDYTVTPSTTGTVTATNGSLTSQVHVYKPTFVFEDSEEKFMEAPSAAYAAYYDTKNYVSTVWSHTYTDGVTVTISNGTFTATDGTTTQTLTPDAEGYVKYDFGTGKTQRFKMDGVLPTVTFTYAPSVDPWVSNNQVTADECVNVNVTKVSLSSTNTHEQITLDANGAVASTTEYTTTSVYEEGSAVATTADTNNATITITKGGATSTTDVVGSHVQTERNKHACDACSSTAGTVDTGVSDNALCEFIIHITDVYGSLQITKKGLHDGESAIFNVTITDPDKKVTNYTVVLTGTNDDGTAVSVTLTDLRANSTYAVTESGDWSWRYTLDATKTTGATGSIVAKQTQQASFENTRSDQWLSDESAVENEFTTVSTETTN